MAETITLMKTMLKSGLQGDAAWTIYSLLIQAFSASAHTIHLTQKLSGKGESAGGKLFWARIPKMPGRLSTVPGAQGGLIWMDFCFPLIFNHLHRAKWMNYFVYNCDWVKHFAFIGLILSPQEPYDIETMIVLMTLMRKQTERDKGTYLRSQ